MVYEAKFCAKILLVFNLLNIKIKVVDSCRDFSKVPL